MVTHDSFYPRFRSFDEGRIEPQWKLKFKNWLNPPAGSLSWMESARGEGARRTRIRYYSPFFSETFFLPERLPWVGRKAKHCSNTALSFPTYI